MASDSRKGFRRKTQYVQIKLLPSKMKKNAEFTKLAVVLERK